MNGALKFLGVMDSYLCGSPEDFVAPRNLALATGRAGSVILDYGCGTGGYCAALAERGFSCTGVDIDPELVEAARAHGVDARVVEPGVPLPFADDSFDTVLLFEVLEHVHEFEFLLREAARVTRRNVLISVPNSTAGRELLETSLCFDHMLPAEHVNYFTRDNLAEALSRIFAESWVREDDYVEPLLYRKLFPLPVSVLFHGLSKLGVLRRRFSYRLFAEAKV